MIGQSNDIPFLLCALARGIIRQTEWMLEEYESVLAFNGWIRIPEDIDEYLEEFPDKETERTYRADN